MAHWLEQIELAKDEFHKECLNVGQEISSKGANFIMCCVDGSSQSDIAFESAMNLRKKFDHVNVFHAYIGIIQCIFALHLVETFYFLQFETFLTVTLSLLKQLFR